MCQSKLIITILFITISVTSSAQKQYNQYKSYEPHECITYVHFDWTNYDNNNSVLHNLFDHKVMYSVKLFTDKNNIRYFGNRMIRDGSGMYLQFGDNCENKTQMSEQIMQQYAKNIPNFPKYFVTEALIMPHMSTFSENIHPK